MFHVVIPARYAASRLPGKPLLTIGDRPLVQWVWQCARASGAASVVIATDYVRIFDSARGFGADCLMTSAQHASGTDRIAEVARARGFAADDIVVNLQGDEPMMPPTTLNEVAEALDARPDFDIATAVTPIQSLAEFLDPSCVKALRARDGQALYFSRAPVPWPRDAAAAGRPTRFADAWRARRQCHGIRRAAAAGVRYFVDGPRPESVRRTAAKNLHRTSAAQGFAHSHLGRGHRGARQRVGAPRAARTRRADAGPHDLGDCAPPVHGRRRRSDHRSRPRTDRGERRASRAVGARRIVRGPAWNAVQRLRGDTKNVGPILAQSN